MAIILILILAVFVIYSYALVDPNITIITHPLWEMFRNTMVQLGYYNRPLSWNIYLILVLALFAIHFSLIKSKKHIDPVKIAILIGGILLVSYPFLSHDFFNYMFSAKTITYYHQNPYAMRALDFPYDPWIRF